jgi:hypothetical protein
MIAFLTALLVTWVFDRQANWALALAVGAGTFFTTGFYGRYRTS